MKYACFDRIKHWWMRFKLVCMVSKRKGRGLETKELSQSVDTRHQKCIKTKELSQSETGTTYLTPISNRNCLVAWRESEETASLHFVEKQSTKNASPSTSSQCPSEGNMKYFDTPLFQAFIEQYLAERTAEDEPHGGNCTY